MTEPMQYDAPTVTKILASVGPHHVTALQLAIDLNKDDWPAGNQDSLEELQGVVAVLSNINVARAST